MFLSVASLFLPAARRDRLPIAATGDLTCGLAAWPSVSDNPVTSIDAARSAIRVAILPADHGHFVDQQNDYSGSAIQKDNV